MKERGREMLFIRVLAAILVLALAAAMQSSIAEAANSPGHDSLYVLRGGDNASGTYNFSGNIVNSSGIGIGTGALDGKLDIQDGAIYLHGESNSDISFGNGSHLEYWTLRYGGGTQGNFSILRFNGTSWSTVLMMTNTEGNVGIGTAEPSSKLDINTSAEYAE